MSAPAACELVQPHRLRTLPSAHEPETCVSSPDPLPAPQTRGLSSLTLSTRGCLRHGLTFPPTRAGHTSTHPVPGSRSPGCLGLEVLLDSRFPPSPHSVCQHILRITHTLDRCTAPLSRQPPLLTPAQATVCPRPDCFGSRLTGMWTV